MKKLKQLEKCVEENKERLRFMENTTEKKFETFESKINTLTKCIEEKDCIIENLTNKLKLQNISEKNLLDSKVKFGKLEKRVYVIEKTKLGNEFCQFCEEEFKSNEELNIHTRFTHIFDCEICGSKFETLPDLETHMHTCERFDCERCKVKVKTLVDMKNHCKSKHRNGADIYNLKFDREDQRKVILKQYNSKDL